MSKTVTEYFVDEHARTWFVIRYADSIDIIYLYVPQGGGMNRYWHGVTLDDWTPLWAS